MTYVPKLDPEARAAEVEARVRAEFAPKSAYASRTLQVNAMAIVPGVMALLQLALETPLGVPEGYEAAAIATAVTALVNIGLRLITSRPVTARRRGP